VTAQFVEIAFPVDFATKLKSFPLIGASNQRLKAAVHSFALGFGARHLHCLGNEHIIKIDIGSHALVSDVYWSSQNTQTLQEEQARSPDDRVQFEFRGVPPAIIRECAGSDRRNDLICAKETKHRPLNSVDALDQAVIAPEHVIAEQEGRNTEYTTLAYCWNNQIESGPASSKQ
jgi:hypothetical protein